MFTLFKFLFYSGLNFSFSLDMLLFVVCTALFPRATKTQRAPLHEKICFVLCVSAKSAVQPAKAFTLPSMFHSIWNLESITTIFAIVSCGKSSHVAHARIQSKGDNRKPMYALTCLSMNSVSSALSLLANTKYTRR